MVSYAPRNPGDQDDQDDQDVSAGRSGGGYIDSAIGPCTGYQVDLGELSTATAAAMSISQDVGTPAGKVGPAISVGTSGGLRIGAAIGRAEPLWTNHLVALSELLAAASANLQQCADSYGQAESTLTDSMTSSPSA